MHPILFKFGSLTIYTYGFCIALGALLGGLYMWWQGKKQFGWTFDQANTLFVLLITAGVVGGKVFIVFENPSYYLTHLAELFSGNGFVFYGSLLTAIPVMLWYIKKIKIPTLVIGATYDTMDPTYMEWMSKEIPGSTFLMCNNGSHMCMWDDQETYMKGLIKFLKQ